MDRNTQAREMVYCHQCENEWYRDEHGLECPQCHSEFTEVIEPDHDPRDDHVYHADNESEPSSIDLPPLQTYIPRNQTQSPFHNHNPWQEAPDPDDDHIDQVRWRQSGPNSFSVTGTFYRTMSPQGEIRGSGRNTPHGATHPDGHPVNPILQSFGSMLQGMLGGQMQGAAPGAQQTGQRGHPGFQNTPEQDGRPQSAPGDGAARTREWRPTPNSRITYTTSTRVFPRDANSPQQPDQPLTDINQILGQLFMPPMDQHGQPGGPQAMDSPFGALLASLFNPAAAAHGDAVYTQEALDRVISQLMEQNVSGNAPGPAPADAIAKLPKKKVTPDMLDETTGKGECSICMDEVSVGTDVTVLPCKHWFHQPCIEAWLGEHDTCPHCRKGIVPKDQQETHNTGAHGSAAAGSGDLSGSSSSNAAGSTAPTVPGAFPGSSSNAASPPPDPNTGRGWFSGW